ncbi:MAG: LysM peptidoglycan-binding domain-containing protein, partial [Thermoanaerobaculaceae bacterium]|nr:LysM peptidoglycan-binding domain-containing protein [Thermoanaerobaculaceae bacterium]
MRCATIAILVTLCVGWAAAEEAVNPPPRPLHKIGDHWTPYEPPTELPADAQIYIIQPGDTLWALAKQYLGDPYLWPQLWEKNTYIRDAHWIYPGDPLVVGVKTQEAAA